MKVNDTKSYEEAFGRREELEDLLTKAERIVHHLQKMYNDIDEAIQDYEKEQAALDE